MRKGFSDFLAVALAKAVNGGLTIIFNILLLRYLGPEQFGIFSLCVVIIMLADGTLGSALDMVVMRLSGDYQKSNVDVKFADAETAALIIKILLTMLMSSILIIGSEQLGNFLFHQEGRGDLIWLTLFSASGLLLLRALQIHCQLSGRFLLYGVSDLIHSLLKFGGIGIILVWATPKLEFVLVAFALAPFIVALVGLSRPVAKVSLNWHKQSAAVMELIRLVKWILFTYTITASVSRLDIFLLNRFANLEEVGIFAGGLIFASIAELLGSYIAVVLNPRVIPYYREGRFLPFFHRFQLICLAGSLCIWSAAYFSMEPLLATILPPSFARSVPVFLALLPGSLITMAVFPLTLPFLLFVRPHFFIVMDCLSLPILLPLYIFAIEHHGALGAAWVTAGSKVTKGLLAQIVAWKLAVSNTPIDTKNWSIS
jgi:O-antigen/teichoic acid export membrane protein